MKEGWKKVKLMDNCSVTTGKNDANHAVDNGRYRFYTCASEYLYCNTYKYDGACIILPGNGANVGDVYFYEGKFDAYQRTYVIDNISPKVLPFYLYYQLQYGWKTYGVAKQYGSATNYIKIGNFKDYEFLCPDIDTQKEIVEYLDSSFAKIDKLKENAAKNLEEAKALFQSALKDALEPKEGWEEKKLIKEFSLKSGDNLSTRKQIKGPFDVYGGNGVTGKHIEYNLSGKNILIGRVGALCGNIHFVNAKIWVTDNAFVVKNISEHWHMDFLTYELKYLNLNQYASQTAQPVISNKSMKDVMIMLPPLSEQQSIVSHLDSLSEKVNSLQQNYSRICDECDALKQAILRQVFE